MTTPRCVHYVPVLNNDLPATKWSDEPASEWGAPPGTLAPFGFTLTGASGRVVQRWTDYKAAAQLAQRIANDTGETLRIQPSEPRPDARDVIVVDGDERSRYQTWRETNTIGDDETTVVKPVRPQRKKPTEDDAEPEAAVAVAYPS